MAPNWTAGLLLSLSITLAASQPTPNSTSTSTSNSTLTWSPCKELPSNSTSPLLCATLAVPLDYTNTTTSSQNLTLNLVKLPATTTPRGHSTLYNPGGPGLSGRNGLTGAGGTLLHSVVGTQHDLIAWDPRGSGETLPFSCFDTPLERLSWLARSPLMANASDASLGEAWAFQTTLAKACAAKAGEVGELIGTAFTARDMMRIVDALGEGGELNYWGVSYGTALGTAVAGMFPGRMGRVVLDGVLNPSQYWAGRDVQQMESTDAVFAGFLSGCLTSPKLCALAKHDSPEMSLTRQVYGLIEDLKTNPIVLGPNSLTDIWDYTALKTQIATALYNPVAYWPALATLFSGLLDQNATSVAAAYAVLNTAPDNVFPETGGAEKTRGIRCSDASLRAPNLTAVTPLVNEFYAQSDVLGDWLVVPQPLSCAQWPFAAKERYEGGFEGIETKNPILFVGNTFDPVTPLASARNASEGFVGSRVLVHDGYGHSSLAQPSICTVRAIQGYFAEGRLPDEGVICEPGEPVFADYSVLSGGKGGEDSGKGKRAVGSEDEVLFGKLMALSKMWRF